MKFKCDRYPKLGVHGETGIVAQFENGLFKTKDKAVIEIIKKVPEIELIGGEEAQEIEMDEAVEVAPVKSLTLEFKKEQTTEETEQEEIEEVIKEQPKKAAKKATK